MTEKFAAASTHFNNGRYKQASDAITACTSGFAQQYNKELCALGESKDVNAFLGATATLVKAQEKGGNTPASTTTAGWVTLQFEGHDYVLYNEAVLLYRAMMYEQALDRLTGLFHFKDKLKTGVVVRVAVLLLACHIALRRTGDATKEVETYLGTHEPDMITIDGSEGTHLHSTYQSMLPLLVYLQGNVKTALTELRVWYDKHRSTDPTVNSVYYNNLAVMSQSLGSTGVACLYLSKSESAPQGPSSADSVAVGNAFYNHGTLLLSGPQANVPLALRCFESAAAHLSRVPGLWLRIAQCHFTLYDNRVNDATTAANAALAPTARTIHRTRVVELSSKPEMTAEDRVHIDRAMFALRRAEDALSNGGNSSSKATNALRASVESGMAYAALCLDDYNVAYGHCKRFFELWEAAGKTDKASGLCVMSYQVEALCMMAQPRDALRILSTLPLSDIVEPSRKDESNAPNTEALFLNLVVAAVLNGHYQRAHEILTNITARNTSERCLTVLKVYLELALGNREKAVELIRRHTMPQPLR
eukprot:PhM_4_TR214/c0_g1_i1/m.74576/K12607/CNOT10; CCR4-NOT transcription complex subunit 10